MSPVGPAHAAALAAIHAAAFPPGERWGAAAMAELLALPGVFGFIDPGGGCILARRAGGEAEILTLAVAPAARRRGAGRALLDRVAASPEPLFLEVAAGNAPALALYAAAGFGEVGRRRGYYGPGRDALVLRRPGSGGLVSPAG